MARFLAALLCGLGCAAVVGGCLGFFASAMFPDGDWERTVGPVRLFYDADLYCWLGPVVAMGGALVAGMAVVLKPDH